MDNLSTFYTLRKLPARELRQAELIATQTKAENQKIDQGETDKVNTKPELSDVEQKRVIDAQIQFVERIKKITATGTMSKAKKIKDRKILFDTEHAKFNEEYSDALEMYESIEQVGADYDILLDPFNEYCDLVDTHCKFVKDMNDVEISQAEIEADVDVKAIIDNANEKAKGIRKKYMKLQPQMDVLKKKKESQQRYSCY